MKRNLEGEGQADYDYAHDILFFKTKEREYVRSIEINNMVIDIDKENFLVGIQILEASRFFGIGKKDLLAIPNWQFMASIQDGYIEIRIVFQIKIRNKIIEKNPIIMQDIKESLPNSQMICEMAE